MSYMPSVKTLNRENEALRKKVYSLERAIGALKREKSNLKRAIKSKEKP